jgi:lactate permease
MFILALLPIIWLIVALTALKWEAWSAALSALAVTIVEAFFVWSMPVLGIATAAVEGFAMAIWPITIVIIAAVFTYNLTVHTGAMETIKAMLTSVSSDKRVLVILIGWCFGAFMEGMAGFGTAIAIPASMLVALGLNPVTAILACLLANGVPTMFGSIGIPTTTMASLTGLSVTELSGTQVIAVAPFVIAVPFLMVMLVGGGFKALKGMVGLILVSGITFLVPEFFTAAYVGADLPVVVGAVCSLVCTFLYASRLKNRPVPEEMHLVAPPEHHISAREALVAWSPFILIFVVLLLTSPLVPAINAPLSSIASTINFYSGDPEATLTFKWINTPGVLIFICAIIGGLIQKCSWHDMGIVLGHTCKQMSKTVVTMLSVLGLAKIMGYSGMIADIAAFFVSALGSYYPLVAPLLGALGTFVTGSGTSSSVLFGNVQLQAAEAIGANPYWLVGANAVGVSAGKMLSPQSIAIGSAACDCDGKDGEIFSKILPYFIAFVVLMAIITYAGSFIVTA